MLNSGTLHQHIYISPHPLAQSCIIHGKNDFVTATKLGKQINFLLLQPKILLQQPNILLIERNIPILTNDFVGITKPFM